MKRPLMVTAGTAAGLAAALSYTPRTALPEVAAAAPATPSAAAQPEADAATAPAPSPPVATSGTFTGSTVSTRFGDMQVAVTVTASRLTDVTALAFPAADTKSAAISAQVIPVLREQTLAAQSAEVAEVAAISGATYTSAAWQESVAAALAKAGL